MLQSVMQKVGPVDFPAYTAERIYMREFRLETGLPEDLKRWQQTVDQMLVGVDTDGPIYLMVDQKFVSATTTHRRPGLHVDGYWNPAGAWNDGQKPWNAISAHGGVSPPAHGPRGSHSGVGRRRDGHGYISEEEYQRRQREEQKRNEERGDLGKPHKTKRENYDTRNPTKKASDQWDVPGSSWEFDLNDRPEAIILASDISASRALLGEWEGLILPGGDVTHLDLSHMQEVILDAHTAYAGNVTFVHESLPVLRDCTRTVVRLNVPNHHIH